MSSPPDGRFTVKSAELRLQPGGKGLGMAICDHSEQKRGQRALLQKDVVSTLEGSYKATAETAVATSIQPHILMFQLQPKHRLATLTSSDPMMTTKAGYSYCL